MSTATTTRSSKKPSAKGVAEKLTTAAQDVTDQAKEAQAVVSAKAQETVTEARDVLAAAGRQARDVTEKQPLLVVAGAVALGFALGLAVKSKH